MGVFVLGGRNSSDCQLRTMERYDCLRDQWVPMVTRGCRADTESVTGDDVGGPNGGGRHEPQRRDLRLQTGGSVVAAICRRVRAGRVAGGHHVPAHHRGLRRRAQNMADVRRRQDGAQLRGARGVRRSALRHR